MFLRWDRLGLHACIIQIPRLRFCISVRLPKLLDLSRSLCRHLGHGSILLFTPPRSHRSPRCFQLSGIQLCLCIVCDGERVFRGWCWLSLCLLRVT